MIIGKRESIMTPEAQTRKRSKKEKKEQKSKRPRVEEALIENTENLDNTNVQIQEAVEEPPASPIYIPTLSSPEPETPEASDVDTPIQSHANVDLVTFSSFNSTNVTRLRQERDRLQFAGLRKRHSRKRQLHNCNCNLLIAILKISAIKNCTNCSGKIISAIINCN